MRSRLSPLSVASSDGQQIRISGYQWVGCRDTRTSGTARSSHPGHGRSPPDGTIHHAPLTNEDEYDSEHEPSDGMNVYIHTFGCQMNFLESELLLTVLTRSGVSVVQQPDQADVAVVNGCLVREHAEERAWEKVRALRAGGVPVVGVIGCLARSSRGVGPADFAVSPEHYDRLLEVMAQRGSSAPSLVSYEGPWLDGVSTRIGTAVTAWVAISRGCNNFCSYCVVPHARGREESRSPDAIIGEIEGLARGRCREVVLIGQNVNSYRFGPVDFPDLLKRIDALRLVPRIRFLTSHPRDMGPATLEAMAGSDTICHHLHLPVQAGSDRVLERMNRGYSAARYMMLVQEARALMPDLGITTDLMVGFPGESSADFSRTLSLVRDVEFDAAFTFGYSPRPGTVAATMNDRVSQRVVGERLRTLIDTVRDSAARRLRRRIGSVVEVLVEGESPKSTDEYIGRSREGNVVVAPRTGLTPGEVARVEITQLRGFTLWGRTVAHEPGCRGLPVERPGARVGQGC